MATDIGKVGMVMKGTWNSSATYEALDAVGYNGATYIAKQNVPANTTPTNTTYWQAALTSLISAAGQFQTNQIDAGKNTINVTSYTPYSGTLPSAPNKCIAMLSGFANQTDPEATIAGEGNSFLIYATKTNSRVTVNWIQLYI